METQEQEGDPELTPRTLDSDYTPSHIPEILTAQTNDQERYTMTEKMILDLINKNNESKDLLNERKELLYKNDKLLREHARHRMYEKLLNMSSEWKTSTGLGNTSMRRSVERIYTIAILYTLFTYWSEDMILD